MLTPEQCLAQLPEPLAWQRFVRLSGGQGNRVYRIWGDEGQQWLLRIHPARLQFSVDRQAEQHAWRLTAEQGFAPSLYYWDTDERFSLSEFLAGAKLTQPAPAALADVLAQLHPLAQGERCDYLQRLDAYAPTDGHCLQQPLSVWQQRAAAWQAQMASSRLPLGLCHHDLTEGNLLQRGRQLYLIDFEYAGIGHPLFDLASACDTWSAPAQQQLLAAYLQQRQLGLDQPEQRAFSAALGLYRLLSLLWSKRMGDPDPQAAARWATQLSID